MSSRSERDPASVSRDLTEAPRFNNMNSITERHLKRGPADVKFQPRPPAGAIASTRWPAFLHQSQRQEKHGKLV